jgi:hypothetical protein
MPGRQTLHFRQLQAMNHYKGSASPEDIEKAFPYIVEMVVPEGGFGTGLDAMYEFHRRRNLEARRGRCRREQGRDFIRWCFADPDVATEFADEFGGTIGDQH